MIDPSIRPLLSCATCGAPFERRYTKGPAPLYCAPCRGDKTRLQGAASANRYMHRITRLDEPRVLRGRVGPKAKWDDASIPWAVKRPDGVRVKVPPVLLFWSHIDPSVGFEACWPWYGSIIGGYGRFVVSGKSVSVHRYMYEMMFGPVPQGMDLDHLCRNRSCVNPFHLEVVSHTENVRRGLSLKATCRQGHPYTEENVIRDRFGYRRCRTCTEDQRGRRAARLNGQLEG